MILNLPCLHMMLKMTKVYLKFLLLEACIWLHLILGNLANVFVLHLISGASLFLAERPIARLPVARGRQEGGTQSQVCNFIYFVYYNLCHLCDICDLYGFTLVDLFGPSFVIALFGPSCAIALFLGPLVVWHLFTLFWCCPLFPYFGPFYLVLSSFFFSSRGWTISFHLISHMCLVVSLFYIYKCTLLYHCFTFINVPCYIIVFHRLKQICIKLEFTFQRVFNLCNNEHNVTEN